MEYQFEINRVSRKNVLSILDAHSLEQLNTIPEGFSNNLIWNAAHIVVTQQLLIYGLSGHPLLVPAEMVGNFRKGTRPPGYIGQQEVDQIKGYLRDLISRTEVDFKAGRFLQFKEYPTSYGITIATIEQAISFNNAHEALHLGYMMAIRKRLLTQEPKL